MKKYLHTADWVAWVDCDSYFMDDSKAMTDLIPDPRTHPTVEFIISEDGLTVNTGMHVRALTRPACLESPQIQLF